MQQVSVKCPIAARATPDDGIVESQAANDTLDDGHDDGETAVIRPNVSTCLPYLTGSLTHE